MLEAERLQGVQQHYIKIPGQPAMLESVIQHDQLRFQFLDGDFSCCNAIGILQMRHVRAVFAPVPVPRRSARLPRPGTRG